jgi:glutathionylspermidine synthase
MSSSPTTSEPAAAAPWRCREPLTPARYAHLMRRAIFDCCKWHTQVEDRPVLCPFPLLLDAGVWAGLARQAEDLAREALAAERELRGRTDLHAELGLPRALRRCLARRGAPADAGVRVMRFDFHWTTEGWRISEANTDVAGGYVEASGVTRLVAGCYPGSRTAGDPAGVLGEAMARRLGAGGRVGLMHLSVFTEDCQVVLYLARRLAEQDLRPRLFDARQLRRHGSGWADHVGPLDLVFRFFPAQWLPRLPRQTGWQQLAGGGPVCNPVAAVLTQGKRFPVVWNRLATPLPTWRVLLPETRDPRRVPPGDGDSWVLKPALGHEGQDVGIRGVTDADDWRGIRRRAWWCPGAWAAQRRFVPWALPTPEGPMYPCLGMYVIDGRAAGAYGRVATRPLIDERSREVAVLLAPEDGRRITTEPQSTQSKRTEEEQG